MYFVGIDISKYKHDCFIVSSNGEAPFGVFSFENNKNGFQLLLGIRSINPRLPKMA